MKQRLKSWWLQQGHIERIHTRVLMLLMAAYLLHYVVFSAFFIEDAGITYAYARNFAEGHGFVTYAGGERVEGYSNPLWTFLISFLYLFKLPPFAAAKILGGILGAATLPFVYGIARACRPDREDHVALIPPLLLAASSTFVIWNASGLENSLFNFLLAAGLYRILYEGQRPRAKPLSALCFLGLAITRPEGIVYGAIAGLFRLILAIQARQVIKPIAAWLAVFWVPFLAYHAWRYSYFGWSWPNTYYAKLDGENRFKPFRFGSRGWMYTTNYMRAYWIAYLLPLYAIGLVTLRDRRRYFVLGITVLGMFLLLWNGRGNGFVFPFDNQLLPAWFSPIQKYWDHGRVFFLLGSAALLGILTLFHKGALARLMVLVVGCAAVFFVIFSGGDWMKQWRWYSLVSVPNFLLLGLGVGALADAFPRKWQRKICVLLVLVIIAPNVYQSAYSAPEPETSVKDVRRRAVYMSRVQDRIHLDRATLLDVDMGAHMWFTAHEELEALGVVAPSWQIVDMAGLVDVPMARHLYQEAFMEEYVFAERNPTFAHVHGGWASKTRIPRLDLWETDYIEIPGYPTGGRSFHVGNHVRKNLIMESAPPPNAAHRVDFSDEVALLDWKIPSPIVAENGELYIDLWLKAGMHGEDFRFYVLLDDGVERSHIAALPPGYDWYTPSEWAQDEVFHGRFDFRLPKHITEGSYDIGFLVIDAKTGAVLGPQIEPLIDWTWPTLPPKNGRTIAGSVFFEDQVEVVDVHAAHAAAEEDLSSALSSAKEGDCETGWEAWRQARYHVWRDLRWRAEKYDVIVEALSSCHVQRAEAASTESEKIASLLEAKGFDHTLGDYKKAARPLAKRLAERGEEALKNENWEEAYPLLRDAIALDPRQSNVRRMAEEARDKRLGILAKERDSARKRREREEAREERDRDRAKTKRKKKKKKRNPRLSPERPMGVETPGLPPEGEALDNPLSLPTRLTNPPRIQPRPPGLNSPGSPRPEPTENPPSPSGD